MAFQIGSFIAVLMAYLTEEGVREVDYNTYVSPDVVRNTANGFVHFFCVWRNWRTAMMISASLLVKGRGIYICGLETAHSTFERSFFCVDDSDMGGWTWVSYETR